MATTILETPYIIPSLDLGMQSRTSKFLAQKNEMKFLKNMETVSKLGALKKILGYTKKGNTIASGVTILGCGSLNTSGGTNKLLAFAGTDAYVWNSGTGAWDAQSRTFTASQKFEFENFLDMLFEINGITDAPQSYTGSAWSTTTNVTDMPKAKYPKVLKDRFYLAYINIPIGGTFPSRVWYCDLPKNNAIVWGFESGTDGATTAASAVVTSAAALFKTRGIKVGDPFFLAEGSDLGQYEVLSIDSETQITLTVVLVNTASSLDFWVGGNWFDVKRDDSDTMMGLSENSDRLICYKRFSVWRFQKTSTTATDSLIQIKATPGTTSHRSIVPIKEYTYHLADSGIWRIGPEGGELISDAMQEVIDGVTAANKLIAVGWNVDDQVLKMFVGDVSNSDTGLTITNCVVCYDVDSGAWWTEEIADVINCKTDWVEDSAKKTFIFSNAGEAFEIELGNLFDDAEIPLEAETHYHFPATPEYAVPFTRFKIYGEQLRTITVLLKLAFYNNGIIDADYYPLDIHYQTENEIEVAPKGDIQRASGFSLKFIDMSGNVQPVIERVVAFHGEPELR